MRALPPPRLAVTAVAVGVTPCTVGLEVAGAAAAVLADRGTRLVTRLQALAAEAGTTLRELRGLVHSVSAAVEGGFLDELRRGLADISEAVVLIEHVSGQIDRALPALEATTPTLGMVNATLDQLNATVAQLDAIPGVRIARRIVARPGGRPALTPD